MPSLRRLSLLVLPVLGGFVFLGALVGGCSSSGGTEASGGSAASSAGGGGAAGGAAGMGGTTSSSSSGAPIECEGHTTLDETNCSLLKQDCKAAGEMCIPSGTATMCIYESGVKGPGASCTSDKECKAGSACIFFVCSPYCCPDDPQPYCGSATCSVNVTIGTAQAWVCAFSETCTPFLNDCPAKQQCRLQDFTQELAICTPRSDNPAPEGGPCEFLNDCDANQNCTGQVCRYSCSWPDWQNKQPGQGGCPMGQMCQQVSTNYGTCLP